MATETVPTSTSSLPGPLNAPNADSTSVVTRKQGDPLSAEALQQLKELATRDDSEIDFSDIPCLTEKELAEFVHGPWTPLVRRTVELRIDDEVLEFLQNISSEHISMVNLVLKREAQNAKAIAARKAGLPKAS